MYESVLSLGFSPCPNDTHIFHALVHGLVGAEGLRFAPPHLADVETLNDWALEGRLDITKLSFHALGHVLDRYALLTSGAALGRGCGPLLITGNNPRPARIADWKIAVPGPHTTAALLLRLFQPDCRQFAVLRFDRIMSAVADGSVDAGVIIHESRFTYGQLGLQCVQDLGAWWEETTGLPIPLGCIAARRSLEVEVRAAIQQLIAESLSWAESHPKDGLDYIKGHAQEMEPEVIRSHISLYVNEYSRDLGEEGLAAVRELLVRGQSVGLFAFGPERL